MPLELISREAAMIPRAIHAGYVYGFSVMEVTGLPSGTVYSAFWRLERDALTPTLPGPPTATLPSRAGRSGFEELSGVERN